MRSEVYEHGGLTSDIDDAAEAGLFMRIGTVFQRQSALTSPHSHSPGAYRLTSGYGGTGWT